MPFKYQIIVQWSLRNNRYEAFSPTLMGYLNRFIPDYPKVAYAQTAGDAINNAITQSQNAMKLLHSMSILPPPADIGEVDVTESSQADLDYVV